MASLDDLLGPTEGHATWRSRLTDVAIGAIPLATGALSAAASMDGLRLWYRTLDRPSWNPPDAVFGPVWTGLYALMGVSLVRIVRADDPGSEGARRIGLALADILVLWLAIAATIGAFAAVRRSAGALLVPYLAWVTFATVLTASIWLRNR